MSARQWRTHAGRAIVAYTRAAGGAAVWPEIETVLSRSAWYAETVPDTPPLKRIDPHHLTFARRGLIATGQIVEETATLNGRDVSAYLDGEGIRRRQQTRITRLAAAKRRLYRRYLSWTNDPSLCGQVLERQVQSSLDALRGYDLLLERARPGQVATIQGRPVPGGPLDHAGHVILDPAATPPVPIGFVVEDKNIRGTPYPRSQEVWDLLAKAAAFPTHVPILVSPHAHATLLTFFKAIGALVYQTTNQYFAAEPRIERSSFNEVVKQLRLSDARQLLHPEEPSRAIRGFFTDTIRMTPESEPEQVIVRSRNRWALAAPVCVQYSEMRDERLSHDKRISLFQQLLEELDEAGLEVEPLRAQHRLTEHDEVEEEISWEDVIDDFDDIE